MTCSAMVTPGLVLGLGRRRPEVGGDHHRGQLEERRLGGRLLGEHVESRPLDLAGPDGLGQGVLVHDAAPGGVDDPQARLGLGQHVLPDEAEGLGVLRQVDGDEVGGGHQLLQPHQIDAHVLGPVGRDEGVVGHQPHAEGQRPLGHQGPDPAQADHAQGLAVQLDALPLGALPLPCHQGGVGLGDVPGLGQQQGHGLLGGREDVGLGGVDHHHPPLGGRGHVHVVEPDAGPAHHHQVGAGRQHLGGDRGGGADDQGLGPGDGCDQILRGQAELHVDLVAGPGHQVQARLGQLLRDEHPTHAVPFRGRSCRLACRLLA